MARHPLAGVEASTAYATDRGRHTVLGKPNTLFREAVQLRGLHHGMPSDTERIMPPIIGIQHQNIERLLSKARDIK